MTGLRWAPRGWSEQVEEGDPERKEAQEPLGGPDAGAQPL